MKKISLLLFVLPLFIFANEPTLDVASQYKEALSAYKMKDFERSYEMLSKLYLTKLSDAKLNFYLGRSAYETGHYEIALAAFERVEMLDPANMRNKLEMARTYFMLKMYEASELKLREVLAKPNLPQNVRTNVELYLSKVTSVQKKSFTYASIDMDILYDSNVNYGSLDSKYNIGVGTLPAVPSKGDVALQLYGDIVNLYDIGDKNGFVIKNDLKLYYKLYAREKEYNIQYISYMPSLLFRDAKYLYEFVLGYDILHLGQVDYLHIISVIPRFEYSHSNTLRSIMHLKYQNKKFKQTAQSNMDAQHYELAYALQQILSPSSYLQGNCIAMQEKKVRGSRDDVDYKEYRLSLIYANQFTSTYGAELFGEYRGRNYADYSTLFASTRKDAGFLVAGTFNMKLDEGFLFHIKSDYNRVNSNQGKFAYSKFTVTTGINVTF